MSTRYSRSVFFHDEFGQRYLDSRPPLEFVEADDNRLHTVRGSETLASIAATHYAGEENAGLFAWAIADYQEPPLIAPPTTVLEAGTELNIPSLERIKTYQRSRDVSV